MKKILLNLLAATALVAMAAACQKAAEPDNEQTEEPTPGPNTDPDDNTDPGTGSGTTPEPPAPTAPDVPLLPSFKKVSSFPVIRITTNGNREVTSKETYIPGSITFEDPEGMYSSVATVSSTMQIKGRGNTTWDCPKKPYKIKLDEKNKVFGMKGDKDWVLLAEYYDQTSMRNIVSMQVSKICGMPWTPECRPVEVYFNGDYRGVYTLFEHKETGNSKVNITPVTTETDGGYYLELDDKDDSDIYFRTKRFYKKIKFKDPDAPTSAQKAFAEEFMNKIEEVLDKEDFSEETGYANYIDVDTFVNYFIIEELTKNIDGNMRLSTFFAREKGSKVWLAHVWDFDRAIGNCDYFRSEYGITSSYSEWFVKTCGGRPIGWEYPNGQRSFYQCLFKDPNFVQAVKDRWNLLKPNLESVPAFIDEYVKYMNDPMGREYNEWWNHSGHKFSSEVSTMKTFYSNRLKWLDTNINAL